MKSIDLVVGAGSSAVSMDPVFFWIRFDYLQIDRSRSSGGVGWTPAACYVIINILGIVCKRFQSISSLQEKDFEMDTFFF